MLRPILPLVALVAFLASCSAVDAPNACTPGASIACACVGAAQGAQVCNAAGTAYSACACPDGAAPADVVAVDAVAPADLGADVVLPLDIVDAPSADTLDAGGDALEVDAVDAPSDTPADLACAAPLVACGSTCTDLRGDYENCGACGRACTGETYCHLGTCYPRACSGMDPAVPCFCASGASGTRPCLSGRYQLCSCERPDAGAPACPPTPTANLTRCGDAGCHDLNSDDLHCGACGRVCAQAEYCLNGGCRTRACDPDGATRPCTCSAGRDSSRVCAGGAYGACRCGDAGA